jgi:hypothetical protein
VSSISQTTSVLIPSFFVQGCTVEIILEIDAGWRQIAENEKQAHFCYGNRMLDQAARRFIERDVNGSASHPCPTSHGKGIDRVVTADRLADYGCYASVNTTDSNTENALLIKMGELAPKCKHYTQQNCLSRSLLRVEQETS